MYRLLTSAPVQSFGALLKGKLVKPPSMLQAPRASHWLAGKSQPSVTETAKLLLSLGLLFKQQIQHAVQKSDQERDYNVSVFVNSLQLLETRRAKTKHCSADSTSLTNRKVESLLVVLRGIQQSFPSVFWDSKVKSRARSLLWSLIQKEEVLSCSVRNVLMS